MPDGGAARDAGRSLPGANCPQSLGMSSAETQKPAEADALAAAAELFSSVRACFPVGCPRATALQFPPPITNWVMSQMFERQSFAADVERTYRHQLPQAVPGDCAWMACLNAVAGLALFASTSRRPHGPGAAQSVGCELVGCESAGCKAIDGGEGGPPSVARAFANAAATFLRHTTPPAPQVTVAGSGRKRSRAELDEDGDCPRLGAQRG